MNVRFFSGIFILAFVLVSGMAGIMYSIEAGGRPSSANDLARGAWSAAFERSFNAVIPVYAPSRDLWGQAEYALFREGRGGVVAGTDGWLFSAEEFSCPADARDNFARNLTFISGTKAAMDEAGVRLVVALIPAKARVHESRLGRLVLPECRRALYETARTELSARGIVAADPLSSMMQAQENVFLRTDTHWTPRGAHIAAQSIAAAIDVELPSRAFSSKETGIQEHEGDLLRYVPGTTGRFIDPDRLALIETAAAVEPAEASALFDSNTPEAALVGTSYSANELWNFAGFLKQELQADVLNMADAGLGPFTVMDRYLSGPEWGTAPPRLVIWEIPERYLIMPHEIAPAAENGNEGGVFQ